MPESKEPQNDPQPDETPNAEKAKREAQHQRRLAAYAKIDALRELIGPVKSDLVGEIRRHRDGDDE
jgi:hypothetical protein